MEEKRMRQKLDARHMKVARRQPRALALKLPRLYAIETNVVFEPQSLSSGVAWSPAVQWSESTEELKPIPKVPKFRAHSIKPKQKSWRGSSR